MKKTGLVFIILCIAVCFVPLAGMTVRPTEKTTENRALAAFPSLKDKEGAPNRKFFEQFETWFHEHFAFRNELVYADAKIQSGLFGVSAEDSVIRGKDGWLYYTSTLNDYLGTDRFTEREWHALLHNLAIAVQYAQGRGAKVALVVPPNKNTLYGEHMPYYASLIADNTHAVDVLPVRAAEAGIPYADLAGMFRDEEETLYLKRDSHWNNKGALMAYNRMLDTLGCPHYRYDEIAPEIKREEDGDLNRMLYSFYGEKEENYYYDIPPAYQYANDAKSVEDSWIETVCPSVGGSLLMFRDSFGNTLIPLLSNQVGKAWYSKGNQYRLEKFMDDYSPEYVIMEKVERNLRDFITKPPVISAPAAVLPENVTAYTVSENTDRNDVKMETAMIDVAYCMISGTVDPAALGPQTDIVVSVNGDVRQAYLTGEDSFSLFLKKDTITSFPVQIRVLTVNGEEATVVLEKTIESIDQ